jgi:hypothetical protein
VALDGSHPTQVWGNCLVTSTLVRRDKVRSRLRMAKIDNRTEDDGVMEKLLFSICVSGNLMCISISSTKVALGHHRCRRHHRRQRIKLSTIQASRSRRRKEERSGENRQRGRRRNLDETRDHTTYWCSPCSFLYHCGIVQLLWKRLPDPPFVGYICCPRFG